LGCEFGRLTRDHLDQFNMLLSRDFLKKYSILIFFSQTMFLLVIRIVFLAYQVTSNQPSHNLFLFLLKNMLTMLDIFFIKKIDWHIISRGQ
jgi:hypothetical protein